MKHLTVLKKGYLAWIDIFSYPQKAITTGKPEYL